LSFNHILADYELPPQLKMEALAAMILPHVLQAAFSTLTIAWTQYEAVKEQRAQCDALLQKCTDLLLAVAEKSNLGPNDPMLVHVRSLKKCVFCKNNKIHV
jgi:hypothetical protein